MPKPDVLARRADVLRAAALLLLARLLVAMVAFKRWRGRLGGAGEYGAAAGDGGIARAVLLARRVDRAAEWLPIAMKCLPRAMALSWMLRRERIGHRVGFAIRPAGMREDADALHAWVDVGDARVMGDLPGPWHVVHWS